MFARYGCTGQIQLNNMIFNRCKKTKNKNKKGSFKQGREGSFSFSCVLSANKIKRGKIFTTAYIGGVPHLNTWTELGNTDCNSPYLLYHGANNIAHHIALARIIPNHRRGSYMKLM